MKTNKRKVRKCLNCVKESSVRFDLAYGKYCQELSMLHISFRYNCTRGQLNSEGEGELYETKQSQDKTEIGKEHDKE